MYRSTFDVGANVDQNHTLEAQSRSPKITCTENKNRDPKTEPRTRTPEPARSPRTGRRGDLREEGRQKMDIRHLSNQCDLSVDITFTRTLSMKHMGHSNILGSMYHDGTYSNTKKQSIWDQKPVNLGPKNSQFGTKKTLLF